MDTLFLYSVSTPSVTTSSRLCFTVTFWPSIISLVLVPRTSLSQSYWSIQSTPTRCNHLFSHAGEWLLQTWILSFLSSSSCSFSSTHVLTFLLLMLSMREVSAASRRQSCLTSLANLVLQSTPNPCPVQPLLTDQAQLTLHRPISLLGFFPRGYSFKHNSKWQRRVKNTEKCVT